MTRDEGVIKFQCLWEEGPQPASAIVTELIRYRQLLYDENLIGVYPDGIGFGNISAREPGSRQFVISASQTGHLGTLSAAEFALITDCSIEQNWVRCRSPLQASSESLTHAMIYEISPRSNAVIHVHDADNWQRLMGKVPTTSPDVPYGTPEMAAEVQRLFRESDLESQKVLVMAGHEDGILSFGAGLEDAWLSLMQVVRSEVRGLR